MVSTAEPRGEDYRQRVLGEKRRLLASLAAPRQEQERVLAEVLRDNADCEFAQTHGLAKVGDIDRFREAVPIRTPADFMPWIARTVAGERNLLTADEPIVYFSSSGTTGPEKKIPVTRSYLTRCFLPFYFASFARLVEHHAGAMAVDETVLNLWQDPTSRTSRTEGGQPHLGPSQLDYRRLGERSAIGPGNQAPWSELPERFADADPWERGYLRLRLAAEADIRCVIGINPAIIAALPYQLDRWWPRIVEEMRAGTLGGTAHTAPNPERARRIEDLAGHFGTLRPAHLWPNIEVIFTWTTALASLYLPLVKETYGTGVRLLPAPIASCEGPVAVPIDRHLTAGPLYLPGCLYEFVPAEQDIKPDSATLLADELEPGRDYHVILTHIGGLYRCANHDLIRVVDFVERTPRVEYAGRQTVLDPAGVRLLESQLVRALRAALADAGLAIRNATGRLGDGPGRTPRYEIALALNDSPTANEVEALARALDRRLGEQSAGYFAARSTGDLAAAHVVPTHPEAFLREFERRVSGGERSPRVKDRVFQADPDVWQRIAVG